MRPGVSIGRWLLLMIVTSLVLTACGAGDATNAPSGSTGGGATATSGGSSGSSPTAAATGASTMAPMGTATTGPSGGDGKAGAAGAAWFPLEGGANSLTGAGATFPEPLYAKWFNQYAQQYNVKVNYQPIGSGGGIEQFTAKTVDFGATDSPMKDEELQAVKEPVLHLPMTVGAVVVTYNLPGVTQKLKLDGPTTADIFLGKITKWNAPKIAVQNQGVTLPDTDITVVHRSDSSGTTANFTKWLAAQSAEWEQSVGADKSVSWPTGVGAKGNSGVAAQVQQIEGAVGYNEVAYALQNKLQYAALKNATGAYVTPELQNVTAAAQAFKLPPDLRAQIADPKAPNAYPMSALTWIIIRQNQTDPAKAKALVNLLWWATHQGQEVSEGVQYAKLPQSIVKLDEQQLRKVRVNGQPVIPAK